MKTLAITLTLFVGLAAAAPDKPASAAESWEPIGATWSVLPSSIGRASIGGRNSLVARVRQDGSGDAAEAAGSYIAAMDELFCKAQHASVTLTKDGSTNAEVLHFHMGATNAVSTLAKRMCAKAARGQS